MLRRCLQYRRILIESLAEGINFLIRLVNVEDRDGVLFNFRSIGTRLGARCRDYRDIAERNRKRALCVVGLNFLACGIQNREVAEELRGCGLARSFRMLIDLCEHFLLFFFGQLSRLQACPLREHTCRCTDLNLYPIQARVQHLGRIGGRSPALRPCEQVLFRRCLSVCVGGACLLPCLQLPLYVFREREIVDELSILPKFLRRQCRKRGRCRRDVQCNHCRTEHSGQQTL